MDKKLYMPNNVEIDLFNRYADLNKYLFIKTIEAIIMRGLKDPRVGMLDEVTREIRDDEDIYRAICLLFPEQVDKIPIAKTDVNLCMRLLSMPEEDKSIYNLDNLWMFDSNDDFIRKNVIDILSKKIQLSPKYRFVYKKCDLLDEIFSCSFDYNVSSIGSSKTKMLERLSKIDPIYIIKALINGDLDKFNVDEIKILLGNALNTYAHRYGVSGSELFVNSNNTNKIKNKKLIRCIKFDKDIIY